MLILMSLNSPREHINQVKQKIISLGCTPHEIPGDSKLAIGITGPSDNVVRADFLLLPSVEEVVRVSKKYKLVSREMKSEDTLINVNGNIIGADELLIIAGPCSVESRDQIFDIAGQLKEMGIKFLRAGAYKPRSSPYAFQGLKEKGLDVTARNITAQTIIADDTIFININYPVTIKQDLQSQKVDSFSRKYAIRLGHIRDVADQVVKKQQEDPYNVDLTYLTSFDVSVDTSLYDADNFLYKITDPSTRVKNQPYVFVGRLSYQLNCVFPQSKVYNIIPC